jgi:hypothetical protein
MYVNGFLRAQNNATAVKASSGIVRIGADYSGSQFFNGTIDDVIIFNRSLSANEIEALYANQSTRYLTKNFTSLADGTHTFKAYTQDLAGNVNYTETRSVLITSCACDGSADCLIACSNNCIYPNPTNMNRNKVHFYGAGFIMGMKNLYNFRQLYVDGGCKVYS